MSNYFIKKIFAYLLCLLLIVIATIVLVATNETLALIIILFTCISLYFIFNSKLILFEAFTLYSAYFYLVVLSFFLVSISNMEQTLYLSSQDIYYDLDKLLNLTIIYVSLCYISSYFGYLIFKRNNAISINLDDGVSIQAVNILILVFSLSAIINFYYNIWIFSNGNLLGYIGGIANRQAEFAEKGTTFLYMFGYMAGYLWLYKILKCNKRFTIVFIAFILFTVVMKVSTGRIIGTIVYILSYFCIYYFVTYETSSKKHLKYIMIASGLALSAILLFFLRLISSLYLNDIVTGNVMSELFGLLNFDMFNYYISEKGNLPNISILMKVIDSWERTFDFTYGGSLISPLYQLLPSSLRPEEFQLSFMIKNNWYGHVPGGSLPPTGMGEMFANFGFVGGIVGMFFFGGGVAILHNMLSVNSNYWFLLVYTNISLGFVMIYSKGEFDNLSIWFVFPVLFTYTLLIVLSKLFKRKLKCDN